MAYPIATIALTPMERALIKEVSTAQALGETTALKNMFYADLFEPYYKQEWQAAYDEFIESQTTHSLDDEVKDVALSDKAKQQLQDSDDDFVLLFNGWMKQQMDSQLNPWFSGKRMTDNREQWIYMFGDVPIYARIKNQKVVILGFEKRTNAEILQVLIDEVGEDS